MTEQHVMEVSATEAALDLIQELKGKYGDDLIFHQSGGCCDGSAPMCYEAKDVKLGEIGGVPFYMNKDQYERWRNTDLIIDSVTGIGGMFSLDNGTGRRFLTRSTVCAV
jgi:uncharacterized protein (DUF779 family)